MRQPYKIHGDSTDYRENWTTGGLLAALLAVPALVAAMAAPPFVAGVLLGAVALKVGELALRRGRSIRGPGASGDDRSASLR